MQARAPASAGNGARRDFDGEVLQLDYRGDCRAFYAAVRDLPAPVWLDCGFPHVAGRGRIDVIAADPCMVVEQVDGHARVVSRDGSVRGIDRDPFAALRELLGPACESPRGLPFSGGAIGYVAYDHAREAFGLAPRAGFAGLPSLAIGIYDWVLVVDHDHRTCQLVRHRHARHDERRWGDVQRRLQAAEASTVTPGISVSLIERGMRYADYRDAFARIQGYIRDGDCYQVNYAQRFVAETADDAWTLYQHLREHSPAPYGALLESPRGGILSLSPEQFLSVSDGRVQTRPIKGTRPRGASPDSDERLRRELLGSAKDRAENLMIVDLLRNDLGRVCRPGSISVPRLFEIETFATVHHLVSTVTGELAAGRDAIDLLSACFPGGSITGAPKRRAMEIIDELEPVRREVYCGSILRLGFDGNLDSSIAIRTALLRDRQLYYWAGGGIVADSACEAEYQESLDKAAGFLRLFD